MTRWGGLNAVVRSVDSEGSDPRDSVEGIDLSNRVLRLEGQLREALKVIEELRGRVSDLEGSS